MLLLFSSFGVYIAIIMSNKGSMKKVSGTDDLYELYSEAQSKVDSASVEYASKYFDELKEYKKKISGFNANSANKNGLKVEDVKIGSGETLTADSTGYGTYYIGWCSDEKVFDSSFDDFESPTKLKSPLVVEEGSLITGWYQGVSGMKLGGVRIITIPGELAYGDSRNPCDSTSDERNVPLRFLIKTFEISDEYEALSKAANEAYINYIYEAYYGSQK